MTHCRRATFEADTEKDRDAQAVFERAQKHAQEGKEGEETEGS